MSTARKLQPDEEHVETTEEVDGLLEILTSVANGTLRKEDVIINANDAPAFLPALEAVAQLRGNYEEMFRSAEQWAVPAPVAKEAQVKALDLIEKLNLGYVRGRIVQIMLLLPGVGMQVKAALLNEVEELVAHLARKDP